MRVILDSDVIIECLRGNDRIAQSLKTHHSQGRVMAYTVISLAEIHAGLRKGEEKKVEEFFHNLALIDLGREVGIKAGEYLRNYAKSHQVEIADALIAAAAFVSKSTLYTLNRKHYPMSDVRFA